MNPRKHLSQFFLLNKSYLRRITECVKLEEGEVILEIGAGRGELTQFLATKRRKIICVEIDSRLCNILREKFRNFSWIEIFCRDIRSFSLPSEKIVAVGNIPYHLSFETIEFLIKNREKITRAYLTFQKEFAEKLVAKVGSKSYSFLTCFLGLYAKAKILFNIPKRCFYPKPKVETSLTEIEFKPCSEFFLKAKERDFLRFLKKIFQQRRKKIVNILKDIYPDKKKIESFLLSKNILPSLRPEDIELKYFIEIYNSLQK